LQRCTLCPLLVLLLLLLRAELRVLHLISLMLQVVATGGWPANNAQVLASHEACDGWLHIIDAVLLPTQKLRCPPAAAACLRRRRCMVSPWLI
jgi:hypothetical protein